MNAAAETTRSSWPGLTALSVAVLLVIASGARAADLDLSLTLDPDTGRASVAAVIGVAADHFSLAADLGAAGVTIDGKAVRPDGSGRYALTKPQAEIRYSFALPRFAAARDIGFIDPAGSLLLGSGWYPDWGAETISYAIRLDLPATQRGLAPGTLIEESTVGGRYVARYDFTHPARDITVVAGPLEIGESKPDGLRIRTYFPPELQTLAARFRDRTASYIERYARLIGPYPQQGFAVVSGPAPVGFGFASFTLLARAILPLPFVLERSLGHEVLHAWWGNGVQVDYEHGNWCEALTVFMADYAFAEEEGAAVAREMRRRWLADFAGMPANQDAPITAFRQKGYEATEIVGYNKGVMLFLMLRDLIGETAFHEAVRALWRDWQDRRAGWADLEAEFARAAGRDLSGFFAQWLTRSGAPQLVLEAPERSPDGISFTLRQEGQAYALRLPVRLESAAGSETRLVEIDGASRRIFLPTSAAVTRFAIDPDYRIFRRLGLQEVAPTIRRMITAERAVAIGAGAAPDLAQRALAAIVERPGSAGELGPAMIARRPLLIAALADQLPALLAAIGLPPRPAAVPNQGTAQVWAARYGGDVPLLVLSARDAASLAAMLPAIRHYGGESWLAFDGARVIARGTLPPAAEPLAFTFE
jgi:aminopeptidase N